MTLTAFLSTKGVECF